MKLREIQPADNLHIKNLIQHSLKQRQMDLPGTAYFDPYLAQLYEFYQQEAFGTYWVIPYQKEIIAGVGIGSFPYPNTCELQKLYVRDDFQGQGLAKLLMNTALTFARQHYTECYLETHSKLTEACQLYEAFGFKRLSAPLIETEHTRMNRWYLKKLG
ncbi:GNAT family N-acetyltransferase [Enterococcus sp. LJL90]